MRTIKFRGKRVDNGEWVYGDLVGNCYIIPKLNYVSSMQFELETTNRSIECELEYIDPSTLGQFTGLQDKNGVDVYEGTIISNHMDFEGYDCDHTFEMKWVENRMKWVGIDNNDSCEVYELNDYEVIGNIHDNKELIG